MDIETITYDNYIFKIELDKNQIKLNMTDNTLMEIYEGTVKEDDLYVKPIKKFYSMIIRSLNKETSFNFSIDNRNSKMVCTVSYSTEMVDLEEHIILNKISATESRELLLVRKVKELEQQIINQNSELKVIKSALSEFLNIIKDSNNKGSPGNSVYFIQEGVPNILAKLK